MLGWVGSRLIGHCSFFHFSPVSYYCMNSNNRQSAHFKTSILIPITRTVLKQYRIPSEAEVKPQSPSADPFYDLLCRRVSKVLQENGIDPQKGRYASSGRIAYYVGVTVCLCMSMMAHIKVRTIHSSTRMQGPTRTAFGFQVVCFWI